MSQNIDYQQSSFNAGELSPLVKGREGLEKYKSGLKTCQNALVLAHGPVTARGGLRYIGEVKDSSKEVKLVPFEFNEDQAYVLEMGDEYMRVWMDGGQVVTPDADTVLLLHMNGDDGDIDFIDKSPNGHAISVNGNAQVDTEDPVYTTGDEPGNLLLDGTGDFLSVADHADFIYGSDPLTIDLWFYLDSVVGAQCIYFHKDVTTVSHWIALWVDPDTDEIYFAYSEGGSTGQVAFTYSTGFTIDTWHHIALIRGWGGNVNDWMVTINGVACGSAQTVNMTLPDYDTDPQIGAAEAIFLPDHSPQNHRMAYQGNGTTAKTHKKWGNGSITLDGAGDGYVTADSNDWDFQTNHSIDFWVKHNAHAGVEFYMGQHIDGTHFWIIQHVHGSGIKAYMWDGVEIWDTGYAGEIIDSDWHHIALVKVGNLYAIYKDGMRVSVLSDAGMSTFAQSLTVGSGTGAANSLDGYLDDVRIYHGNPFNVDPAHVFTDDGNTGHTITALADADVVATQKKWGDGSAYFDGLLDELTVPTHANWDIQTNFTLEAWVRWDDVGLGTTYTIFSRYEDGNHNFQLRKSTNTLNMFVRENGNVVSMAGGTFVINTWYHIVMAKVGDDWGLYIDGTQVAYDSHTYAGSISAGLEVGGHNGANLMQGYIDEARIYHGNPFNAAPVVGITDTITIPTGAHSSDVNTKLLLHCNLPLTIPTGKHIADSDTKLLLRGDVMDMDGGIDEARISTKTRWVSPFSVNTQEYPGAGGSISYELASMPWTEEQVSALKWAGVGDILYVCHPDVPVYKISRTDHDVWTCNIVDWDGPPWKDTNDTATTLTSAVFTVGTARDLVANAALFTSSHVGAYFKFNSGWGIITAVTDTTNAVWDIKDALTDAGPTADWEMSAWNSVDGYPSCITFFEDRLCLSGADGEPTKVRFSETGDYENMTIGVNDSDPMVYQILSQKYNKILWLVGGKKLFIGTAGAEFWMSGAGANTPLTPTSVLARRESTIGSSNIQPVTIGSSLMFIQRAGRTVNLWKYEYVNDSFEATDLGILAEHLMRDYAIADIQYAQDPDHIAWILRTDGTLLGLTHMANHDVTGWHKHYTSDGTGVGDIETFAVIPGTSQGLAMDELWVVTKRTIDGSTVRYVEMLTPKFGNFTLPYAYQTDSCITYTGSPATVFSGIDHLEGEVVNILADGATFNTTITSGGFTLATAASVVTAGLPYTVTVEFMVALLTELVQGVTTGKRKRIVELLIMMYETCQLDYGVDASNMFDVWDTTGLTDDTLNSKYVKVEVDGNPEYEPTLLLKQSYPYPFTLLGVVETIEVEE